MAEKEYIEREAFLERVDGIWDCADMVFEPNDKCCRSDDCASCKWRETKNAIRKIAAYLPAADVRPVVRGKWKRVVDFTGVEAFGFKETMVVGWGCNVCGYEVDVSEESFNFCPNCGADMRPTSMSGANGEES